MKIIDTATHRELKVTIELMEDAYSLKKTPNLDSFTRDELINMLHEIIYRIK